jgi:hypothetical protein
LIAIMVISAVAFFAFPSHPSRRVAKAWHQFHVTKTPEAYDNFQFERRKDGWRNIALQGCLALTFALSTLALLKKAPSAKNSEASTS